MLDTYHIEPFQAKTENLELVIHSIDIHLFDMIPEAENYVAFTNVSEKLNISYLGDTLNLSGTIYFSMGNQCPLDYSLMTIETQLNIKGIDELDKANVFTKALYFLYDWVAKYVAEKDIKAVNGEQFVLPAFLYSKDHFAKHFQD